MTDPQFRGLRLLPVEEWPRLFEVPDSPFARAQTLPDPAFATVLVEENAQGEIIGTWMITSVMLLEGLWRREDVRHDMIGGRKLLFGMLELLQSAHVKTAITVIQEPAVAELARKVGFTEVEGGGTLYVLQVAEKES